MLKRLAIFGAASVFMPRPALACASCSRPDNDATWFALAAMMLLPFLVVGVVWASLPRDQRTDR